MVVHGGQSRTATTPPRKDAYIKITLRDAAPVIQFKEK